MVAPSYIELSKSALKNNIKYLKKRIGKAEFVSVIKGNAYGHGIEAFLPLAEEFGINYFAVSDSSEAETACKIKKKETGLIILNMIDNADLSWAIENRISFYVFDFSRLEEAVKSSKKLKIKAKIHIEIETGMNRTGFSEDKIPKLIDIYQSNREYLELEGITTHYAGAESVANYHRIMKQKTKFDKTRKLFTLQNIIPKFYHTASSAAALTYDDTIMDMARIGIAQYGFWPSNETRMFNMLSDKAHFKTDPLKRVLTWKSKVIALKKIKAGKFIGYGNNYLTTKNTVIAVIPVGYYHGYARKLSNLGQVLIAKRKLPVIGMVNMNMIMVDVSAIRNIKIADEVVIIGKQGKQQISVSSFSDLANYVNYEMLVRLPNDIPRIVVD